MTAFVALAALLAALAAAVLTRPLWWRSRADRTEGAVAPEVARLQTQLRQLKALHDDGALGLDAFEQARQPLEQQLAQLLSSAAPAAGGLAASPSRGLAAALSVSVVTVATAGYAWLGSPAALQPQAIDSAEAPSGAAHSVTREQIEAMVAALAERMKQRPDDAEGWAMLGRSHAVLGQHDAAVPAFKRAVELQGDDPTLLADYADALAVVNGRTLVGEPAKLIERALALDPRHLKSLSLAGTLAFDRQDYAGAVRHWEQMLAISPDSELTRQIQSGIDEARLRLAGAPSAPQTPSPAVADKPGATTPPLPAPPATQARSSAQVPVPPGGKEPSAAATVSGRVTLSARLAAQAAPGDTLFVFARPAEGPRMPLAILRKQVRDLPLTFTLDDSMAMSPAARLSSASRVVIGARISKSGNAIAEPGDLQGFSAPVAPGASGLTIEIGEAVGR
jgi:cytochrome c-type biogenesis protein CcmH